MAHDINVATTMGGDRDARAGPRALNESLHVNLRREALIIECDAYTEVLGRWDTVFGCWRSLGFGPLRDAVVPQDIIGKLGYPAESIDLPLGERLPHGPRILREELSQVAATKVGRLIGERPQSCDAAAALESYIAEIPHAVRACVARFRGAQWLALEAVWREPGLLEVFSTPKGRRFAMAAFCLADARRKEVASRRTLYARLAFCRKRELLSDLLDRKCGEGLVNLVSMFEHRTRENRFVQDHLNRLDLLALAGIGGDADVARRLSHGSVISGRLLSFIRTADVPTAWKKGPVLEAASSSAEALDMLTALGEVMATQEPKWVQRIDKSLQNATCHVAALRLAMKWLGRLSEMLPFPSPPFPAQRPLRPIQSLSELVIEGRATGNCLARHAASYAADITAGRCHIFAWEGERRATASIRLTEQGWRLDELQGADGETPPPRSAVLKALGL